MKTLAGYKLAETLGLTFAEVEQCSKIARLAAQHRKRMENVCNYTGANTEAYEDGTERLQRKIIKAVTALKESCSALPMARVEFGGDPRGHTVILRYGLSQSGYGLD